MDNGSLVVHSGRKNSAERDDFSSIDPQSLGQANSAIYGNSLFSVTSINDSPIEFELSAARCLLFFTNEPNLSDFLNDDERENQLQPKQKCERSAKKKTLVENVKNCLFEWLLRDVRYEIC